MRFLCLLLVLPGLCAGAELQVGRPAPPLTLAQVLQAPAGAKANWDALKGNAAVLEFWATGCAACRDQIPHRYDVAIVTPELTPARAVDSAVQPRAW